MKGKKEIEKVRTEDGLAGWMDKWTDGDRQRVFLFPLI